MIAVSREAAWAILEHDALGVGENHEEPDARVFTRNLIQQGFVEALFLECHNTDQRNLNKALARPVESGDYELIICGIVERSMWWDNLVNLGSVAACAGRNRVPVYLLDTGMSNATKWSNLVRGMRKRHGSSME